MSAFADSPAFFGFAFGPLLSLALGLLAGFVIGIAIAVGIAGAVWEQMDEEEERSWHR